MRKVTWQYQIPTDQMDRMGTRAALDMLRYDGARVLSNAPSGYYLLESESPPTTPRWASFGVAVHNILVKRA